MSGQPRGGYTYRFRARPGTGHRFKITIQRRKWFLFIPYWVDWYPVDNAIRSLHHEVIELWERLEQIISHELDDAKAYVDAAYGQLETMNLRSGKGVPFFDERQPQEAEMPDVSKRFEEVLKFIKGKGLKGGSKGTRSQYIGQFGRLKDLDLINREVQGDDYDHVIKYRPPQESQKSNRRKNRGQQQHKDNQS